MNSENTKNSNLRVLPDVAAQGSNIFGARLDRVGMSGVEIPVRFLRKDGGEYISAGRADAFVSLDDPKVKGIHMSRLYLNLISSMEKEPISFLLLQNTVSKFVESHKDMSRSAFLKVEFNYLKPSQSLISEQTGWRNYPVGMECELTTDQKLHFRLHVEVSYSSTCPCSAALARQLISERFVSDHNEVENLTVKDVSEWLLKEESVCATPHSQRSHACLELEISPQNINDICIEEMIALVETSLGTAVQAAVKRIDEQEFARLNGLNLMFCEDAARKMKAVLDKDPRIIDFKVEAKHMESLHPHNAVSVVTKGKPGGYRA